MISLLEHYFDIFAFFVKEMTSIDRCVAQHSLNILPDTSLIRQKRATSTRKGKQQS